MSITNTEEIEKFPPKVKKLFQAKLPLPFYPPSDYCLSKRRTPYITPLKKFKSRYLAVDSTTDIKPPEITKTKLQIERELKRAKDAKRIASYLRQLHDWYNNPTLPSDPLLTVFISRLDYNLSEIELSKHFSKYGNIESIKIIRDHQGKSRGYGFIVYDNPQSVESCVKELCSHGLKVENYTRTILVDIQRSGVVKTWKPRRLGGGLGGRGYMASGNYASAAASGRRLNLSMNPYEKTRYKSHSQGFNTGNGHQGLGHSYQPPAIPPNAQAFTSYGRYDSKTNDRHGDRRDRERSIRDKYSKYQY